MAYKLWFGLSVALPPGLSNVIDRLTDKPAAWFEVNAKRNTAFDATIMTSNSYRSKFLTRAFPDTFL